MSGSRIVRSILVLALGALAGQALAAQSANQPPATWVDKDTGHRVWRLTPEPDSGSLYFNYTAITPDGRWMVYNAPDGIHGLDLTTRKTRLVVPNHGDRMAARTIAVGHKTNTVFYLSDDPATHVTSIRAANFDSGE